MTEHGPLAWMPQVPLPEALMALAALAIPFLMAEMAYSHHRGNFHRLPMYAPVALPPFFALAALLHLLLAEAWTWWTLASLGLVLVLMGLAGSFFHLQGVARQTGGFNLDNVMVGPPLVAPLGFSLLGALALLALLAQGVPP